MVRANGVNDAALTAYLHAIGECKRALEAIDLFLDDHGEVLPEHVNWQHVSAMVVLRRDLHAALASVRATIRRS